VIIVNLISLGCILLAMMPKLLPGGGAISDRRRDKLVERGVLFAIPLNDLE
jgi:hypothetical protein